MEGNSNNVQGKIVLSKKSWTAYVVPTAISLFLLLIISSVNTALVILPLLYAIYSILMIKSYELYSDDDGVWICSGIFPWNKGINGVKWRDLDDATYYTGFMSWALKSYTIKVSYRFTKDSELFLNHMKVGDKAVMSINSKHKVAIAI